MPEARRDLKMNPFQGLMNHSTTLLIAGLFLAGCSSAPSDSEIKKVLEKRIQKESGGAIKLVTFENLRSHTADAMGIKLYILDYQAVIEFTTPCYWEGQSAGFKVTIGEPGPYSARLYEGQKRMLKGQQETVTGTVRFEQSDDGTWMEEGSPKAFSVLPPTEREILLGALSNVAAQAYQYRQRPSQLGGGGGSYVGFSLPPDAAQGVNVVHVSADEIVLEKEGIRATVDKDGALRTD